MPELRADGVLGESGCENDFCAHTTNTVYVLSLSNATAVLRSAWRNNNELSLFSQLLQCCTTSQRSLGKQ